MKILGYDESFNTCDCCGKTNLKGTFTVETDAGDDLHYGSICVTRHTGKPAKQVKQEAKDARQARIMETNKAIFQHPTRAILDVKMAEGHKLGLVGKAFYEHCKEAREAHHRAEREIKTAYGVL